jgi:uncharacterized radical SAM superfamily Fe-S cluster-containing enzyme
MRLIKTTRSICPLCFKTVRAEVLENDSKIYIRRECPDHGPTENLLERDSWLYNNILKHQGNKTGGFSTLTFTLTHRCNNRCKFCYLPRRRSREFTTDEIKDEISRFRGKIIRLSGGEPTLRDDLLEIIRFASIKGKETSLLTNGINLSEIGYVKRLEKAGLDYIQLSMNSLDRDTLKRIERDVLDSKLIALRNICRTGIKLTLSFMVIRKENRNEIGRIIRYAIERPVWDLRIRSAVQIGRHDKEERMVLSDLILALWQDP